MSMLTRMSPGTRRLLQVLGVAALVAGVGLLALGAFSLVADAPDAGAPGFADAARDNMLAFMGFAFAGILLLAFAGVAIRFGFLRPVSEIVATETSAAVEHAAGAAGRGWRGASDTVKVRCRGCGSLDSEDARFCSSCGEPM